MLDLKDLPQIQAVARRIVHDGSEFNKSVMSAKDILDKLAQISLLAPLHQPHGFDGVRALSQVFPNAPQVLCFDTAHHKTISRLESSLALPKKITDQGVRWYGFRGISYQYIIGELFENRPRAKDKVLMAHLGNGRVNYFGRHAKIEK